METSSKTDHTSPHGATPVAYRYEIGADEPPSLALVDVLADLTGGDPSELGPVGDHVDLEALDQFLAARERSPPWTTSVRLDYGEYALSIDGAEIVVREGDRAGSHGTEAGAKRPATVGRVEDELDLLCRHLEVLERIFVDGPIGVADLAKTTGLPGHQVRYSLRRLADRGLVESTNHGARTTEAAAAYVERRGAQIGSLALRMCRIADRDGVTS